MTSMSLAEYRKQFPQEVKTTSKGKSKYNNSKTVVDGISFDSKEEAKRYSDLMLMVRAGLITELRLQVSYVLADAVSLKGEKRKKRAMKYIADFVYLEDGVLVVEDVKSNVTRKLPVYRVKKHLMKIVHNIDIREI